LEFGYWLLFLVSLYLIQNTDMRAHIHTLLEKLKRNSFLRKMLAFLALIYYGNPSRSLQLIAVTGTVGKTTTAFMIKNILEAAKIKTGLISTAGYFVGKEKIALPDSLFQKLRRRLLHKIASPSTTPDPFILHSLLRVMRNKEAKVVVMEVSSFALMYQRIWGLHFAVAVLTNISFNHHLVIHEGMENYIRCKQSLFSALKSSALAVLPRESKYFSRFSQVTKARLLSYGMSTEADIWAEEKKLSFQGSDIIVHQRNISFPLRLNLPGHFNVLNALAAIGAVSDFSFPLPVIKKGLESLSFIPGRLEKISGKQPFVIIVDKANTPSAFQGVVNFVQQGKFKKKIAVYGNFGESPLEEREKLAEIALNFFDLTIITEDDPQNEDPQKGIEDFLNFAKRKNVSSLKYMAVSQRKEAIRKAIQQAKEGDIILILGRGNEKMMNYGKRLVPFDDREVTREVLREEGYL